MGQTTDEMIESGMTLARAMLDAPASLIRSPWYGCKLAELGRVERKLQAAGGTVPDWWAGARRAGPLTDARRDEVAREAFCGGNEALYDHLRAMASYTLNGQKFPSNGLSQAEVIAMVRAMSDDSLAPFVAGEGVGR